MSQPYPGAYPGGPMVPVSQPKYRALRRTALVSVGLMGLTTLAAVIQTIALWRSYDEVKRFVYGLLSEDEFDRGVESVAGVGPLLDLVGYLFLATGIAFVIWLWQARENTEVLTPGAPTYQGGYGPHRHAPGWVVGGWVCPIVQFWYPLQVVQDVVRASEPPQQPGLVRTDRTRALLVTWWAAWVGFWVVLVGGGAVAVVSFISWIVRLVDRADAAEATGDYVDIYDLQDFMVRVALGVNIGFTIATVLLIVAGVAISLVVLRVSAWHDSRLGPAGGVPLGPALPGHSPSYLPDPHRADSSPTQGPPQYAPRPAFPSYSPRDSYGPETYGGMPGHDTYGPGGYRGTTGYLSPSWAGSVDPATREPGPYGPGGYGGTVGTGPAGSQPPGSPSSGFAPRADHPIGPRPTGTPDQKPAEPGGATAR